MNIEKVFRNFAIKLNLKIDTYFLLGVTVLLIGAIVIMVLRLLDQSDTHVKAVKDMKVEYVSNQFQPDISATTDEIERDLRADPKRISAQYRNLILNEKSFELISRMKSLTILELCDCEYEPRFLEYLTLLPNLRFLDVSGSELKDSDMAFLSKIRTLQAVKLSDTKCSGKMLTCLKDNKSLDLVEVNGLMVEDGDLKSIENSPLSTLNIAGTQFTDAGCDSLAKLVTLTNLDVSRTKLTGAGLKKIKTLKKLKDLELNDCQISDAEIPLILNFPLLSKLGLRGSSITDSGLIALGKSKSLLQIGLINCSKLTKQGTEKFNRTYPKIALTMGNEVSGFSRYKDFYSE
jgi:Leucine-rich repeat (LRR) protein